MSQDSSSLFASDSALLARVRNGEDVAFDELFAAHYGAACEYAKRFVGDLAVAEDLVQDVFARILERRGALSIDHSIRGYVLRAVRREVLHYLRHERVIHRHSEKQDDIASLAAIPPPDVQSESAELFTLVEQAAATLPPRTREAFLLRWRYELRYEEIAATMDISVKTVEMHITRALKVLRDMLAGYVGDFQN